MLLVDKDINFIDYSKEAVVTTALSEKKSLRNDVVRGTGELEDMNGAVFTIRRKDLDKFRVSLKYLQDF